MTIHNPQTSPCTRIGETTCSGTHLRSHRLSGCTANHVYHSRDTEQEVSGCEKGVLHISRDKTNHPETHPLTLTSPQNMLIGKHRNPNTGHSPKSIAMNINSSKHGIIAETPFRPAKNTAPTAKKCPKPKMNKTTTSTNTTSHSPSRRRPTP